MRCSCTCTRTSVCDRGNAPRQFVLSSLAERCAPLNPVVCSWGRELRREPERRFNAKSVPMGEGLAYEYVGGYWEQRDKQQWTGCRDIFGD